jgi:hypothetical protein
MLKTTFQLLVLLSLSTILAYSVLLRKDQLLISGQQLLTDLQANFIDQPKPIPHQLVAANTLNHQQPVVKKSDVIAEDSLELTEQELSEDQQDFQCTTTPLEKVTIKKQDQIYRWKDDNGTVHFGDSSFQRVETEQVALKRRQELEYFNLKMSGDEQSTQFSDLLSTRINRVYQILSELIPEQKLEKVTVDLKIFDNINEYRRYSKRFSKTLGRNSNGFYIMRYNQAVVLKRNDFHAGQVALHESTHVINAGIFGYIPRWLNEGLAEYTENMTVTGQVAEIQPNASWSKHFRIKPKYLVSFDELLSAKRRHWGGSKRRRYSYYATSWSLIYFLMSSEQDSKWLGNLLSEKASKRCERIITHDYIDNLYPGGIANLQQRFNTWLGSATKLSVHRY